MPTQPRQICFRVEVDYQCGKCRRWWTINTPHRSPGLRSLRQDQGRALYCPHCGELNQISDSKPV